MPASDMDDLFRQFPELIARELAQMLAAERQASVGRSGEPAGEPDWHALFLHYLADGSLPPQAAGHPYDKLIHRLRVQALVCAQAPRLDMPSGLSTDACFVWALRLMQLLADDVRAALCQTAAATDRRAACQTLAWLLQVGASSADTLLQLQAALLATVHCDLPEPDAHLARSAIAQAVGAQLPPPVWHTAPAAIRLCIQQALDAGDAQGLAATNTTRLDTWRAEEPPPDDYVAGPPARGNRALSPLAGVVLLNPFLPQFFIDVGVVQADSESIASEQLPRAAALLHWLATGRDQIFEFELGVIKLLLGIPLHAPLVVASGLLSRQDMEIGAKLLHTVTEQWQALRSTGVQGLRVSFLQRTGQLSATHAGWALHMENELFDILLLQLPWSFGITRLPWMNKAVFTHWPAT